MNFEYIYISFSFFLCISPLSFSLSFSLIHCLSVSLFSYSSSIFSRSPSLSTSVFLINVLSVFLSLCLSVTLFHYFYTSFDEIGYIKLISYFLLQCKFFLYLKTKLQDSLYNILNE